MTKIVFLVVLWTCFIFKAAEAYTMIQQDRLIEDLANSSYVNEIIIEKAIPTKTVVYSSNVILAWKSDDGTKLNHYSFNKKEFAKLEKLARTVSSTEFEEMIEEGTETSKSYLMAMVDQKLENNPVVAQVQ